MRVLFLATDAFGGRGGIAQSNRDFLRAMSRHPLCQEIVVLPRLAPDPPGDQPANVTTEFSAIGGKSAYIRALLRQLNEPWDFLICAHINLLPFALLAQGILGIPFALFIYGIDVWHPSLLSRIFARRATGVMSVSQISLDKFLGWSGADSMKCCVIPNCAHLEAFQPGSRDAGLVRRYALEGKKVLLTLARLSASEQYKGIDQVLEILPELITKHPDLVYVVAGDGTDRQRLEEKARKLGLSAHVRFTGRVKEEEKAAHYRLGDAFVLAGFAEGFGIVCLEALASGLPVVGSILDGTREALRNGELGACADPRDPADLRQKLLGALERGPGGRPEALSYFSEPQYSLRVHRFVDSILSHAA